MSSSNIKESNLKDLDFNEFNQSQGHDLHDPYEFVDLEVEAGYKWMHVIFYKISWYLLVAYQNSIWLGLAACLIAVQALGILKLRAIRPFMFIVAAIGFVVDWGMVKLGWIVNFQNEFPYWLILLWVQFVLLLPILKTWLKDHRLAFLVGAISGPFAYYAGQSLGVIEVTWMSLITHAVLYGLILGSFTFTCPKLARERAC